MAASLGAINFRRGTDRNPEVGLPSFPLLNRQECGRTLARRPRALAIVVRPDGDDKDKMSRQAGLTVNRLAVARFHPEQVGIIAISANSGPGSRKGQKGAYFAKLLAELFRKDRVDSAVSVYSVDHPEPVGQVNGRLWDPVGKFAMPRITPHQTERDLGLLMVADLEVADAMLGIRSKPPQAGMLDPHPGAVFISAGIPDLGSTPPLAGRVWQQLPL